MAMLIGNELHVSSHLELEAEMCRYNCTTQEELEEILWEIYGTILVINF